MKAHNFQSKMNLFLYSFILTRTFVLTGSDRVESSSSSLPRSVTWSWKFQRLSWAEGEDQEGEDGGCGGCRQDQQLSLASCQEVSTTKVEQEF